MICWQHFTFLKQKRAIHPRYWNCPTECHKDVFNPTYDDNRSILCSTCPQKKVKDKFREQTEFFVRQRLKTGKTVSFDRLLSLLYEVISASDAPKDNLTVKMASFLDVYLHEQSRQEKLDDLEAEKKAKNKV